jgi:predicted CopG family antitoxin
MINEQKPTIKVSDEIKDKLTKYKIIPEESFESVIIRLLDKAKAFDKRVKQ